MLWFAFNYWYYDLWIQQPLFNLIYPTGCDLLSITGITIFEYNPRKFGGKSKKLWFAFNYWYYDLWIQRYHIPILINDSCDLLSITGITIFEYNFSFRGKYQWSVVICFQLLVLRSLNTTQINTFNKDSSCDLLSITGITIFEYNPGSFILCVDSVVICFQLLVLRSLNTTLAQWQ